MITRIVEEVTVEDLANSIVEVKMIIKRKRMMLAIAIRTKGKIISILSMIKIIEIREEEEEGKDLVDVVFVQSILIAKKK